GWSRLNGEGFTLISQLDENSTQAFAGQFAAWQQAVKSLLNESSQVLPTYLYLFETPAALSRFTPESATAVFYHSPRANYLAMLNDQAAIQLGLHQFAHFLVRSSMGTAVPRWYEEGMAEYLGR